MSDVMELVRDQPTPEVFFKSFLELDGANMASILSFDSKSLGLFLNEKNSKYFEK